MLLSDIYVENLELLEASLRTIGYPFSELGPLEFNFQVSAWLNLHEFDNYISSVLSLLCYAKL